MHASPVHSENRFLVTAGSTRQPIDQVRDWGNIFTGNTGFDIARALADLGPVDLCTSNQEHLALLPRLQSAHAIQGHAYKTHAQLRQLLETRLKQATYRAVFMSAAVADYDPAGVYQVVDRQPGLHDDQEIWHVRNVRAGKVKSHYPEIAVLGKPTEKLVDLFRTQWGHQGLLFKFKLEVGLSDEDLLKVAEISRQASGANYLIANTLEMVQGTHPAAYIVGDKRTLFVERKDLAATLVQIVREHQA